MSSTHFHSLFTQSTPLSSQQPDLPFRRSSRSASVPEPLLGWQTDTDWAYRLTTVDLWFPESKWKWLGPQIDHCRSVVPRIKLYPLAWSTNRHWSIYTWPSTRRHIAYIILTPIRGGESLGTHSSPSETGSMVDIQQEGIVHHSQWFRRVIEMMFSNTLDIDLHRFTGEMRVSWGASQTSVYTLSSVGYRFHFVTGYPDDSAWEYWY